MTAKLMRANEALRFIAACAEEGVAIWMIVGFHVVPKGYMEDFDLEFDPDVGCTAAESASQAEWFIRDNDGPDVVWEVLLADPAPPAQT
jgi:hypothetical protein